MNEQMKKDLPTWESEYAAMDGISITKRQRELLSGIKIGAHEGMMYGQMYADWKVRKGYE
jgi:hypothetical protein|tara:strand:+ start:2234 stop:2413 length:180 start_codon:yes stop_codon:yes gene_type:complete